MILSMRMDYLLGGGFWPPLGRCCCPTRSDARGFFGLSGLHTRTFDCTWPHSCCSSSGEALPCWMPVISCHYESCQHFSYSDSCMELPSYTTQEDRCFVCACQFLNDIRTGVALVAWTSFSGADTQRPWQCEVRYE